VASLSETDLQKLLRSLTPTEADELTRDWQLIARDNQLPPEGDWLVWMLLAGRGFGKTRTGAEWVHMRAEANPEARIALIGPTAADARDVMIEGESGVMNTRTGNLRPTYEPSKRRVTWPNGAMATAYSADEPDRLRGPQHSDAWADELAAWRYPDAWDMLMFGLRLGDRPRACVTTTPRPVKLVRDLVRSATTHVTRGSTFDNAANLAPTFIEAARKKYEGTRLGRQELYAEILDDTPGALWTRAQIDLLRVRKHPDLTRIVVAIDPAATSGEESDETGIVVAGRGVDGHGYVLDDLSGRMTPRDWARRACNAYHARRADRLVAEVNHGGEMIETVIRTVDPDVSYRGLHASRGKQTRAEPISALYEQGRVHHVGEFAQLEDQLTTYVPGLYDGSPDRLDAVVWALTELMLSGDCDPGVYAL
jgi:predicted phage terminase large subunit-like protein